MGEALGEIQTSDMASDTRQKWIQWWTNDIKTVKYQKGHGLLLKIRNERI